MDFWARNESAKGAIILGMPYAGLIQGFVETRLSAGLDAQRAREIYDYAQSEVDLANKQLRGARLARAKEHLVRVSELYGRFFDAAGAKQWQALTGITVGPGGEATYPEGFLPAQKILSLRRTLADQAHRIGTDYQVTRGDNKVEVTTRGLDLAELTARRPQRPRQAFLSIKEAATLKPSRILIHKTLQNPSSITLAGLYQRFCQFAQSSASQANSLAERDMEKAPADLAAILAQIWQATGCRRLSLDEIKLHLATAVEAFFFKNKLYADRLNGRYCDSRYQSLFATLASEALNGFVVEYQQRVVENGEPYSLVLEANGFVLWKQKVRILPHLEALLPQPTLEQIENLHGMAVDGDLDATDFYKAAGIDKYDLFKLCVALPDRFEVQLCEGDSLTPLGENRSKATHVTEEELAHKWNQKVVDGGMEIGAFCREEGVRFNRIKWLRRSSKLFKEPQPITHVPPDDSREQALAADTIAMMQKILARDVLQSVPEVVELINGNGEFVRKWGAMDLDRYRAIRVASGADEFPNFGSRLLWGPTVKEEYLALVDRFADLSLQHAVTELKKLHPRMTRGRLRQLFCLYPNLPQPWLDNRRTGLQARSLAKRIAGMLELEPMTSEDISRALQGEGIECPTSTVSSLVSRYRDDYFAELRPVTLVQKFSAERNNRIGRSLLQLAIRCAPPTAERDQIAAVWAKLLKRAGLGSDLPKNAVEQLGEFCNNPGEISWDEHRAQVFAEIVAAYAQSMPRTASENDIRLRILHDYPIDPKRFGQLKKRWERSPGDYPVLSGYFNGNGKLQLQGSRPSKPTTSVVANSQFMGGWDSQRDLVPTNSSSRNELAVLSQALRIALLQPELETMFDDLVNGKPLWDKTVLWVSHALGDNVPVARILRRAGASGPKTIVCATPYGSNPLVTEALSQLGTQTFLAPLDEAGYPQAVEAALDKAIELHKRGQPIMVMDDGGLVSKLIASKPKKYAKYAQDIRVVELTTQGIMLAENKELCHLVISVARSIIKSMTDRASGQAVAGKIVQKILRTGDNPQGKKMVIHGYGNMGTWIAKYLNDAGMVVTIVDTSQSQLDRAKSDGFATVLANADHSLNAAEEKALRQADHVVGITGGLSMDMPRFRLLKAGARWASAASKRSEGAMDALTAAATSKKILPEDNPLIQSRTAVYEVDGKDIYVDGDGWPINFDGGIEVSNATIIQFMHMAMLLGLLVQAAKSKGRTGLQKLDPKLDDYAVKRLTPHLEKLSADVYDPDKWAEDLAAVTLLYKDLTAEDAPSVGSTKASMLLVQTAIRDAVASEDPDKPYTDKELVDVLGARGIDIAHRTVSGLRKALQIPTSARRKSRITIAQPASQ